MRKILYFTFILLLASLLASCARLAPSSNAQRINPGEKIGDFLITTGTPEEVTYMFQLDSSNQPNTASEIAEDVKWGTKLDISTGIYDDTHSGKLDEAWSKFKYELYIEDRPVNLEAFGTIEYEHPVVGKIRFYNVVLVAEKPGVIKVHDTGSEQGDDFDVRTTLTFLPPAE